MCMCVRAHTHVCIQDYPWGLALRSYQPCFLRQRLSLDWHSPIRLGYPLSILYLGLQTQVTVFDLLCGFWE